MVLLLRSVLAVIFCQIAACDASRSRLSDKQVPLIESSQNSIKRWAALGDSYAAGLGAGVKLPQWSNHYCSRYNQSYPFVLHTHPLFNGSTFDYYACSGASSKEVLSSQLSKLSKTNQYDVITLSVGGNDVHFASFLDACIFQWSGGTNATCEAQLNATALAITTELAPRVTVLLASLIPFIGLTGKIYQTGYARFFDPITEACDNVTWSFWYSGLGPWEKQYLTQERRIRMNKLVDLTNVVLKETAALFYPFVEFVEVNSDFEKEKGRFCEEGIIEPDPSREGLLFYEWNTKDNTQLPGKSHAVELPRFGNGSFERFVIDRINEGKMNVKEGVSVAEKGSQAPRGDLSSDSSSDIIPDGFMRVFHPRPGGHKITADKLLEIIAKDQIILGR